MLHSRYHRPMGKLSRVEGSRHNQRRRGSVLLLAVACAALAVPTTVLSQAAAPDDAVAAGAEASASAAVRAVVTMVDAGDFTGAEAAIAAAIPAATAGDRRALEYQRERMRRMRMDFNLDAEAAKARVRRQIPDLADAEFARWDEAGLLERMDIDGERLYFGRAPSNLFRLSAEARARRADPKPFSASPLESVHPHHREVVAAARAQGRAEAREAKRRATEEYERFHGVSAAPMQSPPSPQSQEKP